MSVERFYFGDDQKAPNEEVHDGYVGRVVLQGREPSQGQGFDRST